MRDLVPSSLVEDCVEVYLARHAPTGRGLYLTIVALTIGIAAAMPIVRVPVTVQANGIIRPAVERREARAAESGVVSAVYVSDGDRLRGGDTLVALDNRAIATRLAAADSIARIRADELSDLLTLVDSDPSIGFVATLRTSHRQRQWTEHAEIVSELSARAVAAQREAERLRVLLGRGFATVEHVERQAAAQRTAEAAVREQVVRMRSVWSEAQARVTDELRRLSAEQAELRDALDRHFVVAPVDGTVEMAASLSPGSVLQRGERIATLSPNTELIGEALLSARDIALVQRGTPARLMIEALNYREWGAMDATVVDVADDATLTGAQPTFRVRCRLASPDLRLRNGQRGALGKGMTFRARFIVAERSLLQLLFDGMDDWFNPARTPPAQVAER